jgi:hypothetical protein
VLSGARLLLPSRHSAGQPIIAGWAFQWIAQLGFERDSWTAPVDARRLHPLQDPDQTAAAQIRAPCGRLDANGRVPLSVFDGGYDSAQLTLDLAAERVAVLVRLRSDRCCYADPPPAARSPTGGRPRRHGAKFAFADPATWPAPTATLVCQDDRYGSVTVQAWAGLHPTQQRHPGHGSRGPGPIVRGTILWVQVQRVPARTRPPKLLWLWWAGPGPLDLAGAGRLHPAPPGPRDGRRPAAAVGTARPQPRLSPLRVRRWFPRLLCALGSPASTPKPAGCSPGRPRGRCSGPATRHPAIKKPATEPRKSQPRPPKPPDRLTIGTKRRDLGRRPARHARRVTSQAQRASVTWVSG